MLDLQAPTFEGFRVPTEHPLAIAAGALLSLLGDSADRVWVAMTFVAFLALVAGVYRLGRLAFTPLVGAAAAALLLTRLDYAFLAARGYIDIPFMAMVVWAAALEARAPAPRGARCSLLLTGAGLLRPEAWVLAGLYWCWMAPRASWRDRVLLALLAAVAPVVWALTDWAVTGDPLFSLHYTSSSAEDLGRQLPLSQLPTAIPEFFANLVKLPVLVAAVLGFALAVLLAPRRAGGAAGAAGRGRVHVRADRDRRRVGDRALPGRRRGRAARVRGGRAGRVHDARAGPRAALVGGRGRRRGAVRRRVHRAASQPRALRRGAELPRRRRTTTSCACCATRGCRPGCAAGR